MQSLPKGIFNYVMSKHSWQDWSSATFGCVLHGSGVLVSWPGKSVNAAKPVLSRWGGRAAGVNLGQLCLQSTSAENSASEDGVNGESNSHNQYNQTSFSFVLLWVTYWILVEHIFLINQIRIRVKLYNYMRPSIINENSPNVKKQKDVFCILTGHLK